MSLVASEMCKKCEDQERHTGHAIIAGRNSLLFLRVRKMSRKRCGQTSAQRGMSCHFLSHRVPNVRAKCAVFSTLGKWNTVCFEEVRYRVECAARPGLGQTGRRHGGPVPSPGFSDGSNGPVAGVPES